VLITGNNFSSYFRLLTPVTSSSFYYYCKSILVYNSTCKLIVEFWYKNCKLFLGRVKGRELDEKAYYVFLIEGSGSTRKGFMPFKRQYGYIFTDKLGTTPLATAIAHELGHGAFRLGHPAIAMDDNLMHNTNGTVLRKYQWDNVHDPKAMASWFKDDDDAALEQKLKAFEIYSISEEFVPDINNLKVKYRINDISKIDGIHEIRNVKSIQLLALKDDEVNNNDVVYYFDNDILKDTENNSWDVGKKDGQFTWNGHYNTETDKKVSSKDGEIKLVVSCTADGKVIKNIPGMSVVINGQETPYSSVHDGEFTLTDNVTISIDPIKEDWLTNEDMQKYASDNYNYYKRMCDKYKDAYDVFKEKSPMEYFKENLKEITFFGNKIEVHKVFADILEDVENDLSGTNVGNISIWQPFQMRTKYTNNGISQHGLGLALDMNVKYNPMITNKVPCVRYLIKRSTNLDCNDIKSFSNEHRYSKRDYVN